MAIAPETLIRQKSRANRGSALLRFCPPGEFTVAGKYEGADGLQALAGLKIAVLKTPESWSLPAGHDPASPHRRRRKPSLTRHRSMDVRERNSARRTAADTASQARVDSRDSGPGGPRGRRLPAAGALVHHLRTTQGRSILGARWRRPSPTGPAPDALLVDPTTLEHLENHPRGADGGPRRIRSWTENRIRTDERPSAAA